MRTRNIQKKIYVNEMENNILAMTAKKTGLSQSDIMRLLIVGGRPKENPGPKLMPCIDRLTESMKSLRDEIRLHNPDNEKLSTLINQIEEIRLEILKVCLSHDDSGVSIWQRLDSGK